MYRADNKAVIRTASHQYDEKPQTSSWCHDIIVSKKRGEIKSQKFLIGPVGPVGSIGPILSYQLHGVSYPFRRDS
ncbi:hypothetical protein BTUL_0137g00190 [Botrytis tulipae]|uniref:Uncharacterized protein n=1 Tax=Botrytis tulipae TaxID=87230 RepID=A0A4Z1EHU6_9HELO|nr:hypothetical protein BTUL_0137g00190 [Botrytis tulipae]